MSYLLGIDLGGSSVKFVAATLQGQSLVQEQLSFAEETRMDWAAKIKEIAASVQHAQREPPRAVGISAPGLAAADERSIAYMPGRLAGLEGLDWREYLEQPQAVPVLNDAHAALLGETWVGAGAGLRHVFMLTLGTGVGGAAIVDGHLLRGHIGRAGHIGHTCLDPHGHPDVCRMPGSLEVCIGNCTIQERSAGRFQSTHDLVRAHQRGDAEASAIWLKSVHQLACAIGSMINVLDPQAVLVGGGIARCGATLFQPLQEFLSQIEWRPGGHAVPVLPAALGEFAGAFGAAHHAHQRCLRP